MDIHNTIGYQDLFFLQKQGLPVIAQQVVLDACNQTGLRAPALFKPELTQRELYGRYLSMYVLWNVYKYSIEHIADFFDRHRTAVVRGIKNIIDWMKNTPYVEIDIKTLINQQKNSIL